MINDKPVILVVDDQPQNIELLTAYLFPLEYIIVSAASGEDALKELSGNKIDLILLDVMMPGMDGFEVIRRVRLDSAHRLLPIILVTALSDTGDRVKGIEAGCDDFISKPFDKTEMIARIRSLLKIKAYNDLLKESIKIQNELNEALSLKSAELEIEKTALKLRNKIMEADLDMARNIQKCLIPRKSPVSYISFQYKPMEKVGGDFFDFIRFPDTDWIGIFISDVSGHGVPAAFITAMIKSSILQITPYLNDPSKVLETLNDNIIYQTADNFITTFYGIYKPETREFIYSNAGHNPPYIISNEKLEYLKITSKAIPLAIMGNNELKDMKKCFINERIVLENKSKLILYTDGLTEASHINFKDDKVYMDFESERLAGSFREHFNKPSELFIKGVYNDLIDYSGSDKFEDDVCIICMDIE